MMSMTSYIYTGYFTIILTTVSDYQYSVVEKILQDCWQMHMVNVNVLTAMWANSTVLYTYYPYTEHNCGRVEPNILNYFINGSFIYNLDLFPEKLNNFYKCPVSMVTYPFEPYTILANDNKTLSGIEGTIFNVLSARLNFTPVIKIPTAKNYYDAENCFEMVTLSFICTSK